MTTLTGILVWPERAEGRVRQFADTLIESEDDPIVPLSFGETYPLRTGQELTVEVVNRAPRRRRGRSGGRRPARPVVEQIIAIDGLTELIYRRRPFHPWLGENQVVNKRNQHTQKSPKIFVAHHPNHQNKLSSRAIMNL